MRQRLFVAADEAVADLPVRLARDERGRVGGLAVPEDAEEAEANVGLVADLAPGRAPGQLLVPVDLGQRDRRAERIADFIRDPLKQLHRPAFSHGPIEMLIS